MSRDEAATHSQVLYYCSIDDSDWNTSVMLYARLHMSLETDMEEKLKHRRKLQGVTRTLSSPLYGTVTLAASKFFINGVTATVKAPYDGKVKEKRKGMGAS